MRQSIKPSFQKNAQHSKIPHQPLRGGRSIAADVLTRLPLLSWPSDSDRYSLIFLLLCIDLRALYDVETGLDLAQQASPFILTQAEILAGA